jgi:hypothetical protein
MMEGGHRGDRDAGREMGRKGKGNERWDRAPHGTADVIFRVPLRPFLPFNERALCNTSERNIVGLHLAVQRRACITNLPANT